MSAISLSLSLLDIHPDADVPVSTVEQNHEHENPPSSLLLATRWLKTRLYSTSSPACTMCCRPSFPSLLTQQALLPTSFSTTAWCYQHPHAVPPPRDRLGSWLNSRGKFNFCTAGTHVSLYEYESSRTPLPALCMEILYGFAAFSSASGVCLFGGLHVIVVCLPAWLFSLCLVYLRVLHWSMGLISIPGIQVLG